MVSGTFLVFASAIAASFVNALPSPRFNNGTADIESPSLCGGTSTVLFNTTAPTVDVVQPEELPLLPAGEILNVSSSSYGSEGVLSDTITTAVDDSAVPEELSEQPVTYDSSVIIPQSDGSGPIVLYDHSTGDLTSLPNELTEDTIPVVSEPIWAGTDSQMAECAEHRYEREVYRCYMDHLLCPIHLDLCGKDLESFSCYDPSHYYCVDEKLYQVGFGPNFEPTTEEDSTYIENYQPIAPSGTFEPIEVESTSTNESVEAALNSNSTKPVEFAPFGNSTKPVEFAPFGNGTKSVGVEPFSNGTFQDTADPKSVEVESPVYLDASYRTVGSNETVAIQAPVAVSEDGDALFGNGTVYHV